MKQAAYSYLLNNDALDARSLRAWLFTEGVVPPERSGDLAFHGHRQSLNVAALNPEASEWLRQAAPQIGVALSKRVGTFIPLATHTDDVKLTPSRTPVVLGLAGLVISKSGKDWKKAQDPDAVKRIIERRLASDLVSYAQTWEIDPPAQIPNVEAVAKVLPVKVALREGNTSVLVASTVRLKAHFDLTGFWAVGALRPLGFGRLWYVPSVPKEVRLLTLEEQMEALA